MTPRKEKACQIRQVHQERWLNMLNANQLLELMARDLSYDEASKGRIKTYYSKYSKQMGPSDARTFASTKYLAERIRELVRDVSTPPTCKTNE